MDIDNLKDKWKEVKTNEAGYTSIDKESLKAITMRKKNSNLIKILVPEISFGLLYLFGLFFFLAFFSMFEGVFHIGLAVCAILLLLAIPALSLTAFYKYYKASQFDISLKQTLSLLEQKGRNFIKVQYVSAVLNILLFAICVVLVPLVYMENLNTKSIILSIVIGSVIVFLFSYCILGYYKRKVHRNEELISTLF